MILPLSSIILFDVILGATTPDLCFFRLVLYLLVSACTSSSPKIFFAKLVLLIQYRPEFLFYSYSRSDHYSSVFPSSLQVDPRSVKKDPHVMHCFWFFAFFCHSFSLLTPMKMQLHSFSLISLQHLLWWWRWTTMGILYFPFHTCIHFHPSSSLLSLTSNREWCWIWRKKIVKRVKKHGSNNKVLYLYSFITR